jgi:hypothetical protein
MNIEQAIRFYNAFFEGPVVGCDAEGNQVRGDSRANDMGIAYGWPRYVPFSAPYSIKHAAKALRELADVLDPQPKAASEPEHDWSKAPEWANYMAVDQDGEVFFFEEMPTPDSDGTWRSDYGQFEKVESKNWRDTLQVRPK